ncbi:N-acetylglucosamine-6-phosphate deacetylase [Umezawaea sp. Da 62-37]|uniref:N-acetylglucosamine-6-phosphate deacetylase n=1 Tax=Umezawaea sp. Da 62-37 TaxID=3075927 RepID=UPI0028F6CE71|nr:N-acetylglucosamine-6-phosphate deacetylase [Umezawaea sp. Da 62-37]WNV87468.1 N-acetylglucosamine-6-phosphate deacetylase [Umezawaea sp. Da 62-37]
MRLGVAGALVDGVHRAGDVEVDRDSGRVTAIGLPRPGRGIAVPGFVDIQVNGFAGVDFLTADVEGHREAAEAMALTGVLAHQPTLITSAPDQMASAIATADKARSTTVGSRVLGAHLEGPFLSAERRGTHPVDLLRIPDVDLLRRLLAAGLVTQVTLAPELPGALVLVDLCLSAGIIVSCGHSNATAAEAHAAFDRGATMVTHLFDAMRPFTHRDPGIAGAALTRDDVTLGLIADPSHLSSEAVRLAFRAGPARVVLVTDALAAGGCKDGHFRLGAVEFDVLDGVARKQDGTLVGTTSTLVEAIRHACDSGVPLDEAVNAATRTPARFFPDADLGLLRPGDRADVVVLDDGLGIRAVYRDGIPLG